MMRVERSILVRSDPPRIFDLVSDPLRFPELFRGFSRVEQVSDKARCEGARYLMLLRVGPIDAGGVVRITEWRAPHRFAWTSEQGVLQSGAVSLSSAPGGLTEVCVHMGYVVPGPRLAGFVVEHLTRHIIDRHVHAMLLSIKREVEFELPLLHPV